VLRPSFETLAEFIIGPRFAWTRWQAPQSLTQNADNGMGLMGKLVMAGQKREARLRARPKFAPSIRRKLNLLNRLDRKSLPESVHVDIHKSANL
jgi:hypothetical protein